LLDAAYDASPRDLRDLWSSAVGLAFVAVLVTVAAVAVAARATIPELPWSAVIALGAIVAPPDASAAEAVLREIRLPHRLMVILEGERLFNDAGRAGDLSLGRQGIDRVELSADPRVRPPLAGGQPRGRWGQLPGSRNDPLLGSPHWRMCWSLCARENTLGRGRRRLWE